MRLSTSFALVLFLLLSGAEFCGAQDSPTDQYLQKVSLFAPVAHRTAKEAAAFGKGVSTTPSSDFDPFSYIGNKPLIVPPGIKVMVFSPHPDDEAISSSGLIQRVRENGGKVQIVFFTNGDGYKEAIRPSAKNARISAKDFIAYGKRRQEESVQAACELGVQSEDVLFLGFPDTGIDDLWESYWSNMRPFISPFTLYDRPYKGCLKHWIKYSGSDLCHEIERTIAEYSPDWIVIPDPRDYHPDHATAGVFVLDAINNMYQDGRQPPAQVLTYLVHFKDYPHAGEWAKAVAISGVGGCPVSRPTLSQTEWMSLPLTSEEIEGKRRALLAHASQLQMLNGFFRNFLLPREIFGRLNIMQILAVPQEYAAYFHHPTEPEEPENEHIAQ